jgi:glycosyltransferase involved in cell wall biosynthesis
MHACESVTALLERRGVRMAPAHGDYVPWNSLTMADGSLYVFDWEHSADAPLLFDFFHRVFMPDRLVGGGIPPHAAIKRLLASVDAPMVSPLKEKCGLEADELPAYLLLYLLKLAAREVLEKGEIDRYLLECMRLTLVLAGHPSHLKRVLASAYACEPHKGSEPGVGWGWIQEIARENDTWVITRSNNREAIDAEMRANPNIHLHFAYVDLPVWARFWKRKHRGIRTYYYLWQFAAWRCARKLHREVHFDLAHHVTFVNDWLWTFLALMPLPYIWGPVGSNARCPSDLLPHTRARVADLLRIAVQNLVRWLDPLWWLSAVRASVIIAINQDVANALPLRSVAAHKLIVEPAIAIDNRQNEPITPVRDGTRILYVGRHLAVKGGSLAVEAFSRAAARFSSARLAMIGEGPEEGDLRERARRSGIDGRVDFIPWQPQERVWDYMGSSDIFLFPSMEGAGLAVLEAMRAGLPIVCLKFGGPGTMVTEETGCRVPLGPFDQVADGLATELIGLLADAARRARLGDASRRRAQSVYSWKAKRVFIRRLYRDVLYKPDRLIQLKDPVGGR